MKLLEEKLPTKTVDFFGLRLSIPNGYKWLAADEDGEVWAYRNKPVWFYRAWTKTHEKDETQLIARVELGSITGKETLTAV